MLSKIASLFKKKPKLEAVPDPKIVDAYRQVETALKMLENASYILEDTNDFQKMEENVLKVRLRNLKQYYKDAHFQTSSLRDELILALQSLPNTRLVRK